SFIAAPAMLPPTAPLTASMIRLIMFMSLDFVCPRLLIRASADTAQRIPFRPLIRLLSVSTERASWELDLRAVRIALTGAALLTRPFFRRFGCGGTYEMPLCILSAR